MQEAQKSLITVNRRLARTLKAERAKGKGAYATFTGTILSFDDFLNGLFSFQRNTSQTRWRLSSQQEQMMWANAMSDFHTLGFSKEQTITMARDAYGLMKAYHLDTAQCQGYKEDCDLFLRAMSKFEYACAAINAMSSSAMIEMILSQPLSKEQHMRCDQFYFEGFDEFTPAQQALMDHLKCVDVDMHIVTPVSRNNVVCKTIASDAQDEWHCAAMYAKAAHEKGETVAIVVPQLQSVWYDIERSMAAVFKPGHFFPGATAPDVPYNISSGESLSKQPIIHALLRTFEFLMREIDIQTWSQLLHSPFIKGGLTESSERSLFDIRLSEKEAFQLSIREVQEMFHAMPAVWLTQLQACVTLLNEAKASRTMQMWVTWLQSWISGWGWAQERTLNSAEYQAVNMMYEALPMLYSLDVLQDSFSVHEFVHHVHQLLKDTLFQIETQDKPIQVLGLLEAAGMSFDHIWVVGLTSDAFPAKTSPHPFIPVSLQMHKNMPHCSPTREVAVAQRLLNRLINGADHVVLSYAQHDASGETQLESPLISSFKSEPIESLSVRAKHLRDVIADCQHLEQYHDHVGLPLSDMNVKGGSALFKDQSACPHRAYLKHRLNARAPLDPVMGLSARAQGMIVHQLLENIWRSLKSSTALHALDSERLSSGLEKQIHQVLEEWKPALSDMDKSIEAQRLFDLATAWLAFEKTRLPFSVSSMESRIEAKVCGLTVRLTIDRIDDVGNEQLVLIDYKTSDAKTQSWDDHRMDEPQLPLYAAVMNPTPRGIAFATLQKNNMGFSGVSTATLPDVKPLTQEEWQSLVHVFRQRLSALAEEIKAGYAALNPKNGALTCQSCECQPGCRLYTGGVHA